jgi:hypothetical protein
MNVTFVKHKKIIVSKTLIQLNLKIYSYQSNIIQISFFVKLNNH